MYEYFDEMREDSFLEHHGILGQKWGIRRFQNYDGTLKAAGKKRRSEDRVQKREERKAARAEKKAAKEEKAKQQVRAEIEKAIANVDMDRLSKYKGQMTDDDLASISKRAMALGKVGENLGKYKKELPPSTFDKAVKTLGVMKTGMDAIRNAHSAWNDLKKEFGLDTQSILKDAGGDDGGGSNNNNNNNGPDIFDRIKDVTGQIAKDAATKANEKYQEHKFQTDLKEARDRKKDNETLDWLENLNGKGKEKGDDWFDPDGAKQQRLRDSVSGHGKVDQGFKLKDGDWGLFKNNTTPAPPAKPTPPTKPASPPKPPNVDSKKPVSSLPKPRKSSLPKETGSKPISEVYKELDDYTDELLRRGANR